MINQPSLFLINFHVIVIVSGLRKAVSKLLRFFREKSHKSLPKNSYFSYNDTGI